jgi:hypothetical protein
MFDYYLLLKEFFRVSDCKWWKKCFLSNPRVLGFLWSHRVNSPSLPPTPITPIPSSSAILWQNHWSQNHHTHQPKRKECLHSIVGQSSSSNIYLFIYLFIVVRNNMCRHGTLSPWFYYYCYYYYYYYYLATLGPKVSQKLLWMLHPIPPPPPLWVGLVSTHTTQR